MELPEIFKIVAFGDYKNFVAYAAAHPREVSTVKHQTRNRCAGVVWLCCVVFFRVVVLSCYLFHYIASLLGFMTSMTST